MHPFQYFIYSHPTQQDCGVLLVIPVSTVFGNFGEGFGVCSNLFADLATSSKFCCLSGQALNKI